MKFRCERDTLANAITVAQRAVASRTGALPVLSGLKVGSTDDGIELVGSDLELTIRVVAPADVDGTGSAVVPARPFSEIVHKLSDGPVNVEFKDDEPSRSWNASHPSRGCSDEALRGSGGAGLLYCFAAN